MTSTPALQTLHPRPSMNPFLIPFLALIGLLAALPASGQGFTESDAIFYGEVRKASGGQSFLLQSGVLKVTFVNQSNSANRVTLSTELRPTGNGDYKAFSYSLKVPLAYLPEAGRLNEFLSINTLATKFKVEQISIDGVPATLPDGSSEFYALHFASRAGQYRLDLLVSGQSNSTAGDGIPDWWKQIHGLALDGNVAADDPDGDGWSNLEEFLRGGDPNKSNRNPMLAGADVLVPESGEAGLYLQLLDSDTADENLNLTLSCDSDSGFVLKHDGQPRSGPVSLTYAELKSGRLSVAHRQREVRDALIELSFNDGGSQQSSATLSLRAQLPSMEDGGESSLWLDGQDLPAEGSGIGQWRDRSGRGRPALQPLSSQQPRVTGRAADFSDSKSAHLFFNEASLPAGDHTVLMSYVPAPSGDVAQTLMSSNRGFMEIAPTSRAISYPGAPLYQMDGLAVRGFENAAGRPTTSVFRRQSAQLQNIDGLGHDGEPATGASLEAVLPTIGARRTAAGDAASVSQSLQGQLQEILIYPTALPEQKLRGVSDYLQSKWRGAVVWNFSTDLRNVTLRSAAGSASRIIRGGFGQDTLAGGAGDDVISGGGGDDQLTGAGGADRFVYGEVDSGRDRLTDFDVQRDCIDLSALFWGHSGDARQYLSLRSESVSSGGVPWVNTVLVVTKPQGGVLEIVLERQVIAAAQLPVLIAEGRIRMGKLSIPTTVQLASPGSVGTVDRSSNGSFQVTINRSGAGTAAAMEVPLGFTQTGGSGTYVVEGASTTQGQRTVVSFARGETSKTITVFPQQDLGSSANALEVSVLPNYKYNVNGNAVTTALTDMTRVWLETLEANAVASPEQTARLLIRRSGGLARDLVVGLKTSGTAGPASMSALPTSVTIPAGRDAVELRVNALAAGVAAGPRLAVVALQARSAYLVGSPSEANVYLAATLQQAQGAGFQRWLVRTGSSSAEGGLPELASGSRPLSDYVLAYAMGLETVEDLSRRPLAFSLRDSRPEFSSLGNVNGADLRVRVLSSADQANWSDVSSQFVPVREDGVVRLRGPVRANGETRRYYRLGMTLESAQMFGANLASMAGAARYGMRGNAQWSADQATGNVSSSGSVRGDVSRLLIEVQGPRVLDVELSVPGAGSGDRLALYLDGVLQAQTTGAATRFSREIGPGVRLLTWEFTRGSGNALIRNLAR